MHLYLKLRKLSQTLLGFYCLLLQGRNNFKIIMRVKQGPDNRVPPICNVTYLCFE